MVCWCLHRPRRARPNLSSRWGRDGGDGTAIAVGVAEVWGQVEEPAAALAGDGGFGVDGGFADRADVGHGSEGSTPALSLARVGRALTLALSQGETGYPGGTVLPLTGRRRDGRIPAQPRVEPIVLV